MKLLIPNLTTDFNGLIEPETSEWLAAILLSYMPTTKNIYIYILIYPYHKLHESCSPVTHAAICIQHDILSVIFGSHSTKTEQKAFLTYWFNEYICKITKATDMHKRLYTGSSVHRVFWGMRIIAILMSTTYIYTHVLWVMLWWQKLDDSHIESIGTTSMENIGTGLLEKIKNST